ncbi:MAG: hypothetical protein HY820_08865 [Acidobacteria bacterium]|nr:hypothetical protein [Acidobacteriota bacterium]
MKVVSNASPLITLARAGQLDSLRELFEVILIPQAVHTEVVMNGTGMPGAEAVAKAHWIQVTPLRNPNPIDNHPTLPKLGAGERSAVALALEIDADLILMDE